MANVDRIALVLAGSLALEPFVARAEKFFADDPVWKDDDRLLIPKPRTIERSGLYDLLFHSFFGVPSSDVPPAENVNTLGEVPDSSWFTNRMGIRELSREELVRGPNAQPPPDRSSPLRVVSVKTEGRSPGFTVVDGRDDTFLIKFDPVGYPQLSTSAEVIATKFFHAFGYHVPENHLLFLEARELEPSPEATIDEAGGTRPLRAEDIDSVLSRVGRRPDETYPVLASRYLTGAPLGPFAYHGTRSDDPNDIFAHENRRELRGLRLFSAWLEHHDSRSMNTLDMYIAREGRGYVRHHLIDFGSTLGATPLGPRDPRMGHEYFFEWTPTWKAAVSAGIRDRPWRAAAYPEFTSVGRIGVEHFEPDEWRPEYPNPAFDRMSVEDAFWAAKIIHRFTDESVRTIVSAGRLDDTAAEAYLIDILSERRDAITRHYFTLVNPLDGFTVAQPGRLQFRNLGIESGLAPDASYTYEWFRFENTGGVLEAIEPPGTSRYRDIAIPDSAAPFVMVRIRTRADGLPQWRLPVDVYLRRRAHTRTVVGIDRGAEQSVE